jgi:hypothetical protein
MNSIFKPLLDYSGLLLKIIDDVVAYIHTLEKR